MSETIVPRLKTSLVHYSRIVELEAYGAPNQ